MVIRLIAGTTLGAASLIAWALDKTWPDDTAPAPPAVTQIATATPEPGVQAPSILPPATVSPPGDGRAIPPAGNVIVP
ncbi:MAG: hypothetical protein K0S46_2528 [Moraxellaceae bacterium]|jgi:hypothetical protein|nr:hypothetical protein [Moraxellaceae bacterium]